MIRQITFTLEAKEVENGAYQVRLIIFIDSNRLPSEYKSRTYFELESIKGAFKMFLNDAAIWEHIGLSTSFNFKAMPTVFAQTLEYLIIRKLSGGVL